MSVSPLTSTAPTVPTAPAAPIAPPAAVSAPAAAATAPSQSTATTVKADLVRRLCACPACGAPLFAERRFICSNVDCGATYRTERNGQNQPVPYLLTPADEAEAAALMVHHGVHTVPAFGSRMLRFFAPPPPSPCFDPHKNTRLRAFFAGFPAEAVLLDVGAQNFNLHPQILNFDMAPFQHTDLIGNAHRLPLQAGCVDGIVNTGVLEHVADPDQCLREMTRVLKPGGRVYIETPFLQGEHPDPLDFRRYTLGGLTRQCAQFGLNVIEGGMGCGPGSTWAWIARESIAGLFGGRRSFTCAWAWAGWFTFWLKYLDVPFRRRPYLQRLASSYYVIAQKPTAIAASVASVLAPRAPAAAKLTP